MSTFEERFKIGRETYGHGVRTEDSSMNWSKEAREELMDAVIYIIADYIRSGREAVGYKPMVETDDDNDTILNIINNYSAMKPGRHQRQVSTLLRMLDELNT